MALFVRDNGPRLHKGFIEKPVLQRRPKTAKDCYRIRQYRQRV